MNTAPVKADEGERIVFLLGGQGSQYFGMASVLHRNDPVFESSMRHLDDLASQRCGRSVIAYLYDPAKSFGDPCDDLLMTNLALFMVEFSLAQSLAARGIRPGMLVGSSLGEFVALAVAGHLTPEQVVAFLVELSRTVESTSPPGGMVAVLDSLDRYREAVIPRSDIAIASINNDRHFIISADRPALDRATRMMADGGLTAHELPVSYAFHSPVMESSADGIRRAAAGLPTRLDTGAPPILSSRTAAPLTEISPETCWQVLRGPIHFTDTVARIPHHARHRYVDLTPSSTLAAILRSSLAEAAAFPIMSPFHAEIQNIDRLVGGHAATPA